MQMKIKLYLFFSSFMIALLNGVYLVFWDFNIQSLIRLLVAGLLLGYPLFTIYYLKYGDKLNEDTTNS